MCSPTRAALAHRTQPPSRRQRADRGARERLGRLFRHHPEVERDGRRGAEELRLRHAAFGKWHNTPANETTAAGPFEYWPTGYGFEYFYGFLAGEASQYEPHLVRNTTVVHPNPPAPGKQYHLSEDLADDAINWLRNQKAFQPDKPFFMYWASGASHGPHHVMKEWADKYKGKFDDGWDKYRERAFARAKELGWIPQDAQLTPRPASLASWDSIPESEKPFQRRLMEVFAGFTEHVDVQVGRIVDEVERLGHGDNTLIFYIWGDNGSSAEGQNGTISELLAQNGIPTTVKQHIDALNELGGLDVLGSPKTDNMYHAGWAWAGSTPYKHTKLIASHFGGTRNPMAVRWPARIKPDATARPQFHHVNDIVPTIYEVVGITPPSVVNGIPQDPFDGISLAYAFGDAKAPGRKRTQYFEIMGSRAIYHDGWMASAFGPRTPWLPGLPPGIREWTPDKDQWELYNLERGLVAGQRSRREDAGEARRAEATVPDRGDQEQGAADRRRSLDSRPASGAARRPALQGVDLRGQHDADAGGRRAGARQQEQPRHHRRRDSGQRQWRALRARRVLRRARDLRQGWDALLRVQPVRDPADADRLEAEAPHRQGQDRGRDHLRGAQASRARST